uniref:NADH-ubiquinone oxidoreductase chain 6 n=1 Tax=Meloimorpha japonica TaxID=1109092 RepID=A0A385I1Z1_9ORTH|nr:NADH dehydrogenase subunit 6 [Meloimorpha japonica]AXY63921.1 NADH dehydrogenase subunit 6 [Meloimorpha japonica]
MMNNTLIITMLMINIIMMFMNHPLALTLMIISQTIILSMFMSMPMYSYWFSYILFLVFLGGMLVLFIYMTSLASNELFKLHNKTIIINIMLMLITMLTSMYLNHFFSTNLQKQYSMINTMFSKNSEIPYNLNQLYNTPSMIITIMMISYLLVTLIVIVKITEINHGPLRQNNN